MKRALKWFLLFLLVAMTACNSSDVEDLVDVADGVSRKPIDTTRMGLNSFANKPGFGSICAQYAEVASTLRLSRIRVLFQWNDSIQAAPGAPINFSFYDNILECIPQSIQALVVVTGLPSWMRNSDNWINGNPRETFAELWLRRVLNRYGGNPRILAWQIWNEPNMTANDDNLVMDMNLSPENYVELLMRGSNLVRELSPGRLVVSSATTSINQNFPGSLNYNKQMRDAGAESVIDVWGIHYYGEQFERVVEDDGVADFLNGIDKTIWITESGAQGVNQQLPYVETVWPFLREKIPGIDFIFYYQHTSEELAESSYGLRTSDSNFPVSDLYVFLRDR